MKRYIKSLTAAAVMFAATVTTVSAQTLRSAYFLEGAIYRHELNPAFAGERGYFSFPVLGNFQLGFNSTVGLSQFIYPTGDGKLTTFMNESVSRSKFLNKLPNRVGLDFDFQTTILSLGFKGFGGYNTFGISLKSRNTMGIPDEFFKFMKDPSETVYNMKNLGMTSTSYVEVALGHSHEINSQWTVGAKAKVLVGLAKLTAKIDNMKVTMQEDKWSIEPIGGQLNVALGGISMPTKGETGNYSDNDYIEGTQMLKPGVENQFSYDDIDFNTAEIGPAGMGLAFDLGATFKLNEDWMFSASVLDLGFISWKNVIKGRMNNNFEFNGFNISLTDDNENSFDDQVDEITEDLEKLFMMEKVDDKGKYKNALAATINLGAQYTLPVYDRLKFGLLSTTRIQGSNSWTEGRISANISPVSAFEMALNYAISNFGSTGGLMINFHPKVFSYFIAVDVPLTKYEPSYFVPVGRFGFQLNMGINFTFGSKNKPKYKCVEVEAL